MLGFLPTRAYRPGTPGATTFLSPLSGTFNYDWDSFGAVPDDREHGVRVRVLIALLKRHDVLPAPSSGNVHVGKVLPLVGPEPPVGVPKCPARASAGQRSSRPSGANAQPRRSALAALPSPPRSPSRPGRLGGSGGSEWVVRLRLCSQSAVLSRILGACTLQIPSPALTPPLKAATGQLPRWRMPHFWGQSKSPVLHRGT